MKENWFFIRGLVRESAHWGDFPKQFEQRFPHRKVHLLDLAGNGKHWKEESPLSVPAMTKLLHEDFLKYQQGGIPNYLFALSLGAMVGLEWMHQFSDITGAVLLNTSLRGLSPFYERLQMRNYPRILKLFFESDPLTQEKVILELTSNLCPKPEETLANWVSIRKKRPISKENALRQLFAAMRFQPPKSAPKAKLLILNGERDRLVSPKCSEKIAALWNCEFKRHPLAGHDLTLDAPDWCLDQVAAWLS